MDNSNPNQPQGPFDPSVAPRRDGGFTPPDPQVTPDVEPVPQQAEAAETPTSPAPDLAQFQTYMANNAHVVTTPAPEKKRNVSASISVAAVLVILLGGLAAYWLFNNVASRPAVSVDKLLPANTMAYFTLDTQPDAAEKAALDRMKQAFESQPGFKQAWAQLTSMAAAETGGSPDATPDTSNEGFDSLAQYLGNNVTVAVLPFSSDDMKKLEGASGLDEATSDAAGEVFANNVVGIVDLDFNPLDKKGPISDLKKQADKFANAELVEKYRDVDVRKYVTGTTTVYFSLLNGTSTAVVAAKVAPVRAVIDQFKDSKGLSADPAYLTLTGQVPQERMATFYMNLTKLYDLAKTGAAESGMLEGNPLLANPDARVEGAVLMTLSAHDDGMQLDVASQARTDGMAVAVNPSAKPDPAMLSDIPAGSLGFLLGTDLKSVVQSVLDSVRKTSGATGQGDPSADPVTSTLDEFMQATNLDLEKDVLPLLGGDYALSVSMYGKEGSVQPGVVFQMKLNSKDVPKAQEVVQKLAGAMSNGNAEKLSGLSDPFYMVGPSSTDSDLSGAGMPVSGAALGVAKDRLIFVFDMDSLALPSRVSSLLEGFGKGLGTAAKWQEVPRNLPRESNAIMYIDITGARNLVESQMPPDEKSGYEEMAAPFLRPFKYVAVGSASQPAGADKMSTGHAVLFIGIGK